MINSRLDAVLLPYPDKEDRRVWVYVPKHEENEKLPVIYMTDGQNLFDTLNPYFGCWNADKAVDEERESSGKSAVIVGVDNGNEYRDSELTPKCIGEIQHRDQLCESFKPEGEIFDKFFVETVIPYVESHYPVRTDRASVSVCGSSSGGLMSFFIGVEHSEKFGFIGSFSPAFILYKREDWLNYLMKKIGDDMPYLYLYCGGGDRHESVLLPGVDMLYDELLPEAGYPYERMSEVILFDKPHNESAWKEIFKDFVHSVLQ